MTVTISPNIRKTSARIDINGNILNRQGQIVEPVETPYIPSKEELNKLANAPTEMPSVLPTIIEEIKKETPKSKIDEMINNLVNKKVEELVARKVEEALKNL